MIRRGWGKGWRGLAAAAALAAVLLIATQAAVFAKPLGAFQNLTGANPRDDTSPDMRIDYRDAAHIVYQSYDGTDNDVKYATNASGAWVTESVTDDGLNDVDPRLRLDSNGHAHLAWAHWDGRDYEVCYATNRTGAWVIQQLTDNEVDDTRPSIAMSESPELFGIDAASDTVAWAVGAKGTVLKTTNGGATWTRQASGVDVTLYAVAAADANTAWAVGEEGTVIHTTNGGTTWNPQNSGTANTLLGVTAADADTAWAVGFEGTVLHTADGGANWTAQANPSTSVLFGVDCADTSNVWAVGIAGTVINSTDGGTNWATQTSGTTETLYGISAVDASTAWAAGSTGTVIHTIDGGANWNAQDAATEDTLKAVKGTDANHAWLAGSSGSIYETEDGGNNWEERDHGLHVSLNAITARGADTAWAAGRDSMILATADGGDSWQRQDSGICGKVWVAFESYKEPDMRSCLRVHSDVGGSWQLLHELQMAVATKRPSLAVSDNGTEAHLAFVMQDSNYWKVFYEKFDAEDGEVFWGVNVAPSGKMQAIPSIDLFQGIPMIAYEGWTDSGADSNYDIYAATLSGTGFSTSQLTDTSENEMRPVLRCSPRFNQTTISYLSYTGSRDYYPGMIRMYSDTGTIMVDTYSELTTKVAAGAVSEFSVDGYNVHMCYAGQDPDLDVYYGFLSPNPWVYKVDPDSAYPRTSPWKYSLGAEGQHFKVCGTDFGTSGTLFMHRLEEDPPGSGIWVDRERAAAIHNWSFTEIEASTPEYNYEDLRPVDGGVRVRAYGRDSNTNVVFHPLYPTITRLNPDHGWPYDYIDITGLNFGETQDKSVVYYGIGYAAPESRGYYPVWEDKKITSRIPAVATEGNVAVLVKDGSTYEVFSNEMPFDLTLTDVDWYFAEGYTGGGFQEFLCILNPNDVGVTAKVNFILDKKDDNFSREYAIPAHHRFTLSVNGEVPNRNVSLRVSSSGRIVCERPMYFNYRGVWTGGHDVVGANQPSNEWYFAEGTTRGGFDEWLCIMNPDPDNAANICISYMNSEGKVVKKDYTVQASSRCTVNVNEDVGPDQDISIELKSEGAAVVAERPMYFSYGGAWTGGHITMGAQRLASNWYFAEGTTRGGFDEWLCIGNPGMDPANAKVTYYVAGEPVPTTVDYLIAPKSRYTIKVNDAVGAEKDVSVSVVTDKPTVAERPMYFNYQGVWTGGHNVIGSNFVSESWYFAEGTNQAGFHEWLCLLNSNNEGTEVRVSYVLGTGGVVNRTYEVGAFQRFTVFVNDEVPAGSDISIIVDSDLPILAERPMYFNFQGWTGGHNVVGYSPVYTLR